MAWFTARATVKPKTLFIFAESNFLMRDMIRRLLPTFLLNLYRGWKKQRTRRSLLQKQQSGHMITTDILKEQLLACGIKAGDTLLVHSSMSKTGFLENGPKTLIDALLTVIGNTGNLLMPSSPNPALQKEYAEAHPVFDVLRSPSRLGAVTEYFRTMPGVVRSFHPTEPVCAFGPDADELTRDHFDQPTPYNKYSPFYKVAEKQGKILYIGVTLTNAGTSLHLLEDAVAFKYPVYCTEMFNFKMIDKSGNEHSMDSFVHNPAWSAKRKCDELIPLFEKEGVLKKIKIGEAPALLVDAHAMLESMLKNYFEKGITMYTPKGEHITA